NAAAQAGSVLKKEMQPLVAGTVDSGGGNPAPVRRPPIARLWVLGIEIEDVDPGNRTSGHADQGAGISCEELLQGGGIAARSLEAARASRPLGCRNWKTGVLARQGEGDGEGPAHGGPPYGGSTATRTLACEDGECYIAAANFADISSEARPRVTVR